MKTENISSLVEQVVQRLKPSDLQVGENRLVITSQIDQIIEDKGWTKLQFGNFIRTEIVSIRTWLSDTRDFSMETLTEICQLFHISVGDLVVE